MGAGALAGCDTGPEREVTSFSSLDQCKNTSEFSAEQCDAAYLAAQNKAENDIKYSSKNNCDADFSGGCERNSNGYFVPLMAGFMVSQVVSNVADAAGNMGETKHRKQYEQGTAIIPAPLYRSKDNPTQLRTSGNSVVGSVGSIQKQTMSNYKYNNASAKPKAVVTSRGGFGKAASARGGWGG
tara:strand:- start:946 stop:1494 length:549 start_codon:yes stop_codon:yes gene_type:complete